MQDTATKRVRGRHSASTLGRHRAPRANVVDRGRSAMITALLAGVGVAGLSAVSASASAAGDAATPAAQAGTTAPRLVEPRALPLPDVAVSPVASRPAAPTVTIVTPAGRAATPAVTRVARKRTMPTRSWARVRQMPRPKVRPKWVNPMPEGHITSCFGPRWGRLHAGVDLAAPLGTPIRAVGAGRVVHAGQKGGYGLSVLIDHGNGYLTHYGHMSALSVEADTRVESGQEVGKEGSTGHSTGPHLHFEVHKGVWRNTVEPTAWLRAHGVGLTGCAPAPKTER